MVDFAAEVAVQRTDCHVLEARHYGFKPWQPLENGFREIQRFDLLCNNHRYLKTLKKD